MKVSKSLIFIFLVIFLLALTAMFFPKEGVKFFDRRLFFPTLEDILTREKSVSVLEKMQILEESLKIQQFNDSVQKAADEARNDTVLFLKKFFTTHSARFYLPKNDLNFFAPVFAAMENCREDSAIVHILHYGDSQIEEDRITGYFRQHLQEKFGGIGAGLLPAVQPIPSAAIGQSASENIKRHIIEGMHKSSAGHSRYGVLGQTAQVNGSGTVSFHARNYSRTFENTKKWTKVRVFVSRNSANFSAKLTAKNFSNTKTLQKKSIFPSVLEWNFADSVKNCALNFTGNAEISGISLDGKYGVTVDNIPIRGSSGTYFSAIDTVSTIFMLKNLNVRLIFLEFGGNTMPSISSQKNIDEYMQMLEKQILHWQKICPQAKIVLIGPADMSKKVRGKLQTYPLLSEMVEAMKTTANRNGAAFWDMYSVMGGHNSMLHWVKEKPALAAPDYIHFTPKGADKIAEMLFEAFMRYYEYWKIEK
ncbi:MAG: GDSL-type esterase/lipase family protein [Prevotellaceae bacterium]|jgi:lysophospholipase L1-like esterase|nr:GDSL-type esterase/lipase family protein [Prevotellaceae bacterium]